MLSKELSPIDWTEGPREVIDRVRGLIPWPVATAELGGAHFKIFRVENTGRTTEKAPGTLLALTKQGLEIACGQGGVLVIRELQADGGKRMDVDDALTLIDSSNLGRGDIRSVESNLPEGTVTFQSIDEGEQVKSGTTINLQVSKGP